MATAKMTVPLESLDLGYLAQFVGMRLNEKVLEELHAAGFRELRHSHGYLFQHLIEGPRTIGELAERMEVTQQAVSKTVGELERLGFLEEAGAEDRRVRRIQLSARGRASVERARALRRKHEAELRRRFGAARIDAARRLLAEVLERLGGAEAVQRRRVRAPK